MSSRALRNRELWRWYILLLIANELDLAYTYLGLNRGTLLEANPLVAPHLYTWWPLAMKLVPLAGLALGLAVAARADDRRQRRALGAVRFATAVYTAILVMHLLNLLTGLRIG